MTPDNPSPQTPAAPEQRRSLWSRIPRHLLGGRVRTTTAVMVLAFVGLLVVYGQRADHYAQLDEAAAAASAAPRTPAPSSTREPVPETTPTRTSTPSSAPSSTDTATTTPDGGAEPTTTETPTTTTGGGAQFPPIPGLRLPGQTPTTTPAR